MSRAALVRLLQATVLIALAVLLWQAADGRAALSYLSAAQPGWLLAAALALTLQTLLSAQRWRVTAGALGLSLPRRQALGEYYLAQVVNQSLPGGVIGDAGRAVRSRGQMGLRIAASAVIYERLAGQLGLIALLLAGLALGAVRPGTLDWPAGAGAALLAALALTGIAAATLWAWPKARHLARGFVAAVWAPQVRATQIALSLGTALCNIAAFGFCAWALDVTMPVLAMATLVPLILFAMVVPLSIAGWGLREGAAALVFPVMGASAAQGLATSIAFGLIFVTITLPGLIWPILRPI